MMGTPRAFAFFCGDAQVMDAEDPVVDYYDAADDPRLRSRTVEETKEGPVDSLVDIVLERKSSATPVVASAERCKILAPPPPEPERRRWPRRLGPLVVLVAVGAVAGGVASAAAPRSRSSSSADEPRAVASAAPTAAPAPAPTPGPTSPRPSSGPSRAPSRAPSGAPTRAPSSGAPSARPSSAAPSRPPSPAPSPRPSSRAPSALPSPAPSSLTPPPSARPSAPPSRPPAPSAAPSSTPPSAAPSAAPSDRRWKLLVLEAFPAMCAATDWDALLAEVYADGAEQLLDVALKRRVYDGPSWLRLVGDLFEASDVPLTVSDVAVPGNPLVFGNAAFRDLVGYDFDEFLGRNCRFLLETAKSHCDAVKRVATGRRLENLVVQHQNAYAALERRHASRLLSMERRQEKALANLKSLLHVELAKLDKQYRTALSANYATFDEAQAVARVDFAAPRPPSAPPRLRRRASSVTRNDGKTFGSPRTLHGSMWTAGPV